MESNRLNSNGARRAFTLVELLVVIGIIAVLIGILIPVLASARKTAQTAKCASALREIGNAFKFYAIDNNQYYPPMRVEYLAANPYKVMFGGDQFNPVAGAQTYWMYFLGKYVSKQKFGVNAGATPEEVARAMNSVLWGCPNFVPIQTTSTVTGVGGIAMVYTGYGMNGFPGYTASYPSGWDQYDALGDTSLSTSAPPNDPKAKSYIVAGPGGNWSNYNSTIGTWFKMGNFTSPGERALVGDCRAFVLQANKVVDKYSFCGQANLAGTVFWATVNQSPADTGQSSYDYYRHGKYPPLEFPTAFSAKGGKISYNLLYADGHVANLQSRDEGFKAARMRFPG